MNKTRIPIFLASDVNYLPYLAVTVKSISDHSSDDYIYDVRILTEDITEEDIKPLSDMNMRNVEISLVDVNEVISKSRKLLRVRLRDYYSEAIYFRLYIAAMFPKLERALYIDCDIVLVDDIAKLYFADIGNNILGVIADESIPAVPPFAAYVKHWVNKEMHEYFNSGVLVMNLVEFRRERILEKFSELINKYNFDTVAPDQDYLNFLCHGRVKYLPAGWNKQPSPAFVIPREEIHLIHFNFYNKPWHYSGVMFEDEFWRVADSIPFAEAIHRGFDNYTDAEREEDKLGGDKLVSSADELSRTAGGFRETLGDTYYCK